MIIRCIAGGYTTLIDNIQSIAISHDAVEKGTGEFHITYRGEKRKADHYGYEHVDVMSDNGFELGTFRIKD